MKSNFNIGTRFVFVLTLILALAVSAIPFDSARAASTWTVNSTNDNDDSTCDITHCSLREAINAAGNGDTIDFDLTYPATITAGSQYSLSKSLTINGPGKDNLTISGGGVSRLFVVFWNDPNYSLNINNVTLESSHVDDSDGGAINIYGNLTVDNVVFKSNQTAGSGKGAAIYVRGHNGVVTANITNTIFDSNQITGSGVAAALYAMNANVTLSKVTFVDNTGGAIQFETPNAPAALTIANTTFSGNSTSITGGAIRLLGYGGNQVTANIYNTTFAENTATGGGSSIDFSGPVEINAANAIFADNSGSNCRTVFNNLGYAKTGLNNLSTDTSCNGYGITTAQKTLSEIGLGTFSNSYYPLTATSPAVDAGDPTTCSNAPVSGVDQLGTSRPQIGGCDIGAYELPLTQSGPYFTVNTTDDDVDGEGCQVYVPASSDCTLREAIEAANAHAGADEITFAGNYTITLDSQPPAITGDLTIDGSGKQITVDGDLQYRVFSISNATVVLNTLNIINGDGAGGAGVLNTNGDLSVINTTFNGNVTSGNGGAIYNSGGALSVTNSTFENNAANGFGGGGIYSFNGTLVVSNSSFSGNLAANGGGVAVDGSGNSGYITNSTFKGNDSGVAVTYASTLTLKNSLFAENTSANCQNTSATLNADTTNMADDSSCDSATQKTSAEINLGSLADSGGLTKTFALPPDSAAIDAGDSATCAAAVGSPDYGAGGKDQRGVTRSQGNSCDVGAYEYENATRYAIPSGSTSGDCASWISACDLMYAISTAISGDEVWVASGTYTPHTSDRSVSFALKNGVEIYGGFAGTETQRSQRNPAANQTTLSGEIDTAGVSDNSYHVVNASSVDNTAVLDGFVITAGYGSDDNNLTSTDDDNGGGLFANNGSPTLRNLTFYNNHAEYGGGLSSFVGSPVLSGVTFANNTATDGGGLSVLNSSPTLTNVTFSGNSASQYGGAIHSQSSASPVLMNGTISGNTAGVHGGGVSIDDNSDPILTNVIIWGNTAPNGAGIMVNDPGNSVPVITYSIVQGGFTGTGNLNVNPMLGTLNTNSGFTQTRALNPASPAIDTGTNTGCPATDQRGKARPQGAKCDIGAYEAPVLPSKSLGTQDGWVLESSHLSSKGGSLNKTNTVINIGNDAQNREYYGILSFNTSALAGKTITKITLKIKRQGVIGGGNPVTALGGFMVDIKKGTFGTSALQLTDFQARGNKTLGAFKPALSGGWYTINLTTGKAYINKTGLTQIRIRFKLDDIDNAASFLKLYSGNAGAASRPQLIVEYTLP